MAKFVKVKHQVTGKTKSVTEETFKLWRPVFDPKSNSRMPNNGYVIVGDVKLSEDSTNIKTQAITDAGNKILEKAKADAKVAADKIIADAKAKAQAEADKILEDAKNIADAPKADAKVEADKKSTTKKK